jgi:hypothetical protein
VILEIKHINEYILPFQYAFIEDSQRHGIKKMKLLKKIISYGHYYYYYYYYYYCTIITCMHLVYTRNISEAYCWIPYVHLAQLLLHFITVPSFDRTDNPVAEADAPSYFTLY